MSAARVSIAAPATKAEIAEVAPLLARAFLDDPVWSHVGPRRRSYRRWAGRVAFWGIVRASARNRARIRVARAEPGGPAVGATIAFEPEAWPPPERAVIWQFPWAGLAGPLPVFRGLRADGAIRAAHVTYPHLYLWYIGVEPGLQGGGVGRALMADLNARADSLGVPAYLETATRPNLRFYESLGYEVVGELTVPAYGPRLWRVERRPAAGPGGA
ncbi:MAG TPA: GNAT family N-acetyltransferase [Solirubrobacterales bacterium]|nr:GNAT family N-acetyltransferase [Solirubrobacterales bacterium]